MWQYAECFVVSEGHVALWKSSMAFVSILSNKLFVVHIANDILLPDPQAPDLFNIATWEKEGGW